MIISSVLMISCNDEETSNKKVNQKETPKAFEENKLDIARYSSNGNLIEELYQELADKDPSLKNLETDLDAIHPKYGEANEEFNTYDAKSKNYYGSAEYLTSYISDSLLKIKINNLITSSKNNYHLKTKELSTIIEQISRNKTTIKDQHQVLKIVLTLPLIEKYQDENKPKASKFNEIINTQNNLIFRMDSLNMLP